MDKCSEVGKIHTRFFNRAVLGSPISHSLSPSIHDIFCKEYNVMDDIGRYHKIECTTADIGTFISNMHKNGYIGCNITAPLKQHCYNIAISNPKYRVDDVGREIGAINTLCFGNNDSIDAINTDAFGFIAMLLSYDTLSFWRNKTFLIFGAGGVAAAILYGLQHLGIRDIMMYNRTKERAESIRLLNNDIKIIDDIEDTSTNYSVLINATNQSLDCIVSHLDLDKIYIDTRYDIIKRNDVNHIIGTRMLAWQGWLAHCIWYNIIPNLNKSIKYIMSDIVELYHNIDGETVTLSSKVFSHAQEIVNNLG